MTLLRLLLLAALVSVTALVGGVMEAVLVVVGTPLALLAAAIVLALDGGARALAPRRAHPVDSVPDTSSISVVIPSWNGRALLERLLPSLFIALRHHGGEHEVIVVDNGSDDGTTPWLEEHHPSVRIVRLAENAFFGRGIMHGIRAATRDIVVLLNNDMVVAPDFLRPLLEPFDDPRRFAVTAQIFFSDDTAVREETGKTEGAFRRGRFALGHRPLSAEDERAGRVPIFWAGGGSSAVDRRKLELLGGFDPLYDPFYLEDVDLSYRAWKRGWSVLLAPASHVVHEHRGTVRRFPERFVQRVVRSHQYLFLWKNVTDARATLAHALWLMPSLVTRVSESPKPWLEVIGSEIGALLRALSRAPRALRGRLSSRHAERLSDREVWAAARQRPPAQPARSGLRILVLSARLPRLDTDGSWILFNLLKELARRHEVTLFAFVDSEAQAAHAAPLRAFCAEVVTHVRGRTEGTGNLHHQVPYRLATDYAAQHMRQAVDAVLARASFDIVQVEYAEMAHLVHRVVADLPAIYTVHEPLHVVHERLFEQARGITKIWRAFAWAQNLDHELGVVRAFRRVVTLSSIDERGLRDYLPDLPAVTIPSGVDPERFRPTPGVPERQQIVFVGYFQHPPNTDAALWLAREIFPRVRAAVPGTTLSIVGRDPTAEVNALRHVEGIEVTGFVPDLRPVLAAAAVVAVPIRLGGGLRGKVLEAWAAGKALVTTARGGAGFPLQHGVNALVADDAAAFADQLVACLRDPLLRARLGARGRELVEARYTAAATAEQYERVYAAVLGELRRTGDAGGAGDGPVERTSGERAHVHAT